MVSVADHVPPDLVLFRSGIGYGSRGECSAFGNPLVWWAGIPAFAFMLYRMFVKKDRKAAFLSVGYLSQYAPWFKVTRVVFIYHYFPSVPFVTVMVGYSMYLIVKKYPKVRKLAYVYTALAVGLFIMFYPVCKWYADDDTLCDHIFEVV